MKKRVVLSALGLASICGTLQILRSTANFEATRAAYAQDEPGGALIIPVEEETMTPDTPGSRDCAGRHEYSCDLVMTLRIPSKPSKPKEEQKAVREVQERAAKAYLADKLKVPKEMAKQDSRFLNERCKELACESLQCIKPIAARNVSKWKCVMKDDGAKITSPVPSWKDFTCMETQDRTGNADEVIWDCRVRYSYKRTCWCEQEEEP